MLIIEIALTVSVFLVLIDVLYLRSKINNLSGKIGELEDRLNMIRDIADGSDIE